MDAIDTGQQTERFNKNMKVLCDEAVNYCKCLIKVTGHLIITIDKTV